MKLEIRAMVAGKPAYAVLDLPPVVWICDDASAAAPAVNTVPDSIRRIDLVDGTSRATKR